MQEMCDIACELYAFNRIQLQLMWDCRHIWTCITHALVVRRGADVNESVNAFRQMLSAVRVKKPGQTLICEMASSEIYIMSPRL